MAGLHKFSGGKAVLNRQRATLPPWARGLTLLMGSVLSLGEVRSLARTFLHQVVGCSENH